MHQLTIRFQIPEPALRMLGVRAIAMIRTRTQETHIDASGQPFTPYSTRPFVRPLGGITQKAMRALGKGLQRFTTRQGRLWALITGGYAAYKAAAFPEDGDGVNLTQRGHMLGALTVVGVSGGDGGPASVRIGFTRHEEALKALYHNVTGAGKRHVIRRFLGLTPAERKELARMAGETIIFLPALS
ncbi:MAG TPA: hypothetical protein VHI13_18990 [Candidatus Kapabacteria bacterium]|nr:hypothetical protein [Candidatus Kapabacteria bacterium]